MGSSSLRAAAGDNAGTAGRGQPEFRGEGLHDFQVLLGNGYLRHLLHIPGRRLEDGTVLGDEIFSFAPSGIRLTVPGEGGQVGHGQHAHGFQRSRQPLPFLLRLGEQPRRALYAAPGRNRLMLVERPPPLAPVAFQHLQRRGLRLSSCHRHENRLPSTLLEQFDYLCSLFCGATAS